jgi:tetrapyrrole methylase family protein/MazG family protein
MPDANEIAEYTRLRDVVARLHAPDGCPWDREQTHASLRPYLLQEAYEVLHLLDEGDTEHMPEELGDLLCQILMHTQLAEREGEWAMTDVLRSLSDKLVRRHPHVFGDPSSASGQAKLSTAGEVASQWDEIKKKERAPDASALASVPVGLPALAYSQELLRRAESAGFAWPHRDDVLEKLHEEVAELADASSPDTALEELGDILFNVVNYARYLGLDAEDALRAAGHKFRRRFNGVEQLVASQGSGTMKGMTREELMRLWGQVKATEARP